MDRSGFTSILSIDCDHELEEISIDSEADERKSEDGRYASSTASTSKADTMRYPRLHERFRIKHSKRSMSQPNINMHISFGEGMPSKSSMLASELHMAEPEKFSLKMRTKSVFHPARADSKTSLEKLETVRQLLLDIYDTSRPSSARDVSDTLTDTSSHSDSSGLPKKRRLTEALLFQMDISMLREEVESLTVELELMNQRLLHAVRQRSHQQTKTTARNAVITAVLQAVSKKTSEDSKMKFSLTANPIDLVEWKNAVRAMSRFPGGIPAVMRKNIWLSLADDFTRSIGEDWPEVRRRTLCDQPQPDDGNIHSEILKDLHRTGQPGFTDERRLKQVLLAYARYNKEVGYCQGFNVLAARILQVVDFHSEAALKIFIFMIEGVLPGGYFDRSLGELSVDMAVMKDLMAQRLPKTLLHLETLQKESCNEYEPPLTNVFCIHWLLTVFATCLPVSCVYRVWDAMLLEGSEILLRTAIAIWARISGSILRANTADEFYMIMEKVTKQLLCMTEESQDAFISMIYDLSPFPYPGLSDLRDKHRWNIQPLTPCQLIKNGLNSLICDECGIGAGGKCCESGGRKCRVAGSDLRKLRKQFAQLKKRQREVEVIMNKAFDMELGQWTQMSSFSIYNHLKMSREIHGKEDITPPCRITGGALALVPVAVQPINTDQPGHLYLTSNSMRMQKPSTHDDTSHLKFARFTIN